MSGGVRVWWRLVGRYGDLGFGCKEVYSTVGMVLGVSLVLAVRRSLSGRDDMNSGASDRAEKCDQALKP